MSARFCASGSGRTFCESVCECVSLTGLYAYNHTHTRASAIYTFVCITYWGDRSPGTGSNGATHSVFWDRWLNHLVEHALSTCATHTNTQRLTYNHTKNPRTNPLSTRASGINSSGRGARSVHAEYIQHAHSSVCVFVYEGACV